MEAVNQSRNVDNSVLDVFWQLVETEQEGRIAATISAIRLLLDKQEMWLENNAGTICPDLQYSVERLVKGISSTRKAARQGYALALTEILKFFPAVTLKEVLSLMDKHLPLSSKQEKCQMVIGQLLTYSSIVRSGRLKGDLEYLPAVALQLYLLSFGRCYIQETTYKLMSCLFTEIREENFRAWVWPKLKKKLSRGWETCSPDVFWLLLLCLRMFPKTVTLKFLLKYWGCKDILSRENFEHLQKIVKQSTSVHPQFSPVCSELLHFVLEKKKVNKFWNAMFDEILFKSDQNEKTYLGFKVIKAALMKATNANVVSSILSRNFSSVFTRCLLSYQHPMHSAAAELGYFLGNYVSVSGDPHIQLVVLKALIQPPGTVLMEQMLNKKEVCAIINHLSYEAVKLYYEILQCLILQKPANNDEGNEEHMNWKRCQAFSQIGNLVSHLTVLSDTEWRLEVTKFLFLHSYFEIRAATEDINPKWIPRCGSEIVPLHRNVHLVCMHSFNRALDSLNRKTDSISHSPLDQQVSVLKAVADFADKLLQSSDRVIPLEPLEKIQEPWNNMMNTVKKLSKQIKKDGKTAETAAFQIFFLQLGLQLFSDEGYIPGILEELQMCCKRAMKHRKDTEGSSDDPWVQVIVDVMLSLISQESLHMRHVVNSFFSLIRVFITREAIQQILDVINPERAKEEDILVESSGDEIEDIEFASGSSSGEENEKGGEDQRSEKNEEDISRFKLKIQEALGAAADVSDTESMGGMLDSEMVKLDKALSAAFRSQKKVGHLQFSTEQQTLMHFRMKCLDLISIYLKSEPRMTLVLQCILPILSAYQFGLQNRHQGPLSNKARSTLELLVRSKKFQDYNEVEFDDLRKILKHVIDIANKASNTPISVRLLNSLCVYMVLCERKLELSFQQEEKKAKKPVLPSCLDQFKTAFNVFVNEIRSCLTPHFFIALMNACPETAWSFVKSLQDSAFDANVRLFKRAQCLGLLVSSFGFSKGQKAITSEMWLDVFETIVPKAVEALSSMLCSESSIKPTYTAELLQVLITIVELKKEKCGEAVIFKDKDELLKVLIEISGAHKKQLAPQGKRSLNKLIRALGGEVPVTKQSEKKRKASENEEDGKKIKLVEDGDGSQNVDASSEDEEE